MQWLRKSYLIGKVLGIPIRVHISLVILAPLLAWQVSGGTFSLHLLLGLLVVVLLFASVALHELGHSWVALKKGCRVRQILLLPIGGVAQLEALTDDPRDEIHIALAGPLVSIVLAGLGVAAGLGLMLIGLNMLAEIAFYLGGINLVLALFNMIPSFPMDGGRVLRAWMTPKVGHLQATRIAAGLGQGLAVVFGIVGIFGLGGSGNPILVLIAVFIFLSARAEVRAAQIREMYRWRERTPPPPPWVRMGFPSFGTGQRGVEQARPIDAEVVVSPPPPRP